MTKYLIDLFCGIGGVSTGFSKDGWKVAVAVDFWDEALKVHELNHPQAYHKKMEIGTPQSKKEILRHFPKLGQGDVLHIHASPPCQRLSTMNKNRQVEDGMYMTLWTLEFLMNLSRKDPRVTWTIEQVPNSSLQKIVTDFDFPDVFYHVMEMTDYGVCQRRRRTIISNVPLSKFLSKVSCKSLEKVIDIPKGTKYITNSSYSKENVKKMDTSGFLKVKTLEKGKTISYAVVSKPNCFVDAKNNIIRSYTLEDNLAVQTYPKTYMKGYDGKKTDKLLMVANSVPPSFSNCVAKAIDKYHASR